MTSISRRMACVVQARDRKRDPITVRAAYNDADPLAITLTIGQPRGIVWTLGRDLLHAGIEAPSGDGDVHVAPEDDSTGDTVRVILDSPSGHAELLCPRGELASLLEESFAVVAAGTELEHGFDSELAALLEQPCARPAHTPGPATHRHTRAGDTPGLAIPTRS